jgi:hypothetical protein
MTAIDLLHDDAHAAREIVDGSRPKLSKQQYLAFNREMMATEEFRSDLPAPRGQTV